MSLRLMRKEVFITVLLMSLVFVRAAFAQTDETVPAKKILILFNNDPVSISQISIDRALRSTIKAGSPGIVETYSEYVGNIRAGTGYEAEFVALLKRKYEGKKFDAIFCVGQFPLSVIMKNRAELFPNTPVAFIAIDKRIIESMYPAQGLTGVWGEIDYAQNLELALKLHPNTKHIVLIEGSSETDKAWARRARAEFSSYTSRLDFTELVGLTIPEMQRSLAALPAGTVAFFISGIQDKNGNIYDSTEYLRKITPASAAPIYCNTDGQFGNGAIGGRLVSFETLGNEAGKLGLRLLAGESPDSIAAYRIESRPTFDARELKRWNIDEADLPEGSTVLFTTPTIWSEYKEYILPLIGAIIVETLLIAWLLFMRVQRRKAEAEAHLLTSRIKEIVSNVPGVVWETRTDPAIGKRRTTFISAYVEKMLGYTPEEWLGKPPGFGGVIMPEEDREQALRESEETIATGKENLSEFRWITKDGRIKWIENYMSPIVDDKGSVIGLRGVALDVTARKAAEEKVYQTEKRDRAILSALPDLMFIQSLDGVYVDFHAKDLSDLFVAPDQFLGKSIRDVLPPELGDKFLECFAQTKDGGEPEVLEYSLEMDGSERWYEARMVRNADQILSIVRDITTVKRSQQDAYELGGRLIKAQEDERSRLARELHDGVSQTLALLSIELSMFGKRTTNGGTHSVESELKMLSERVSSVSDELRRISQELHPVKLTQLGLVTAVRSLCKEVEAAHGLKIDFEETAVPNQLDDNISLGIYRIVQEALQNVVKHSRARGASVKLALKGQELMLEVDDDGKGFDPIATRGNGSLGLISMRERVRLLDGYIKIDSKVGKGTKIRAALPAVTQTQAQF